MNSDQHSYDKEDLFAAKELVIPVCLEGPKMAIPSYARPGDAGLDLCSTISCTLAPFERRLIPTGIALEIPEGYAGFVLPRSGLAIKHGLSIVNAPGLIDSGYRGEIKVPLINLDAQHAIEIEAGDRIAQLVILATPYVRLQCVDSLTGSERGTQGFGSSGQ